MNLGQQAFVIEAKEKEGIARAHAWAREHLGMSAEQNPDIVTMRYGLLSVEDARRVAELAAGKAFVGETRVVIIAASRAYHEAQNALLKLFEEPPANTYLFLILPSLGGLLPTLRSRVQILTISEAPAVLSEEAQTFIQASKETRSALIKKLTSGKDEDARRENREKAIELVNGIESVVYKRGIGHADAALLSDIATLRTHLYDRSAPVKMILEHLSLVIPPQVL